MNRRNKQNYKKQRPNESKEKRRRNKEKFRRLEKTMIEISTMENVGKKNAEKEQYSRQ